MKPETVEKKLGLTYPRAFREIYEAGAMRWLCGRPQAKSHLLPNLLLEQKWYPYWNLLPFSAVERMRGTLCLRIELDRGRWKESAQPLPFAADDDGDIYFFDAALAGPDTPVFNWARDCGAIELIHHSFEHFICSHLCWPVLHQEMPLDHWWVQNQLRWLTPEHQKVWASGHQDALETLFSQTNCCEGTHYVTYLNNKETK